MDTIIDKIYSVQTGNKRTLLELLEQFRPLLKKYALKLYYEDAYNDLQVRLIEIIKQLSPAKLKDTQDSYLAAYFKSCIEHEYIKLSQKQKALQNIIPFSAFHQDDDANPSTYFEDKLTPVIDEYPQIEYDFLLHILTQYEADIIICTYYYRYPSKMIARMRHVSAPAICQAKANAIAKLEKYILTERRKNGHNL